MFHFDLAHPLLTSKGEATLGQCLSLLIVICMAKKGNYDNLF